MVGQLKEAQGCGHATVGKQFTSHLTQLGLEGIIRKRQMVRDNYPFIVI
jgi:hypothetical protein